MAGSCTSSQNGARSPTASGSIDGQPLAGRHLDQAEDRLERLLRDELGVEGEPADRADMIDELAELSGRGDQAFVRHSRELPRTEGRGRESSGRGRGYGGRGRERELPPTTARSQARAEAGSVAVAGASRPSRNWRMTAFAAAGFSYGARWPAAGMTSSRARGMACGDLAGLCGGRDHVILTHHHERRHIDRAAVAARRSGRTAIPRRAPATPWGDVCSMTASIGSILPGCFSSVVLPKRRGTMVSIIAAVLLDWSTLLAVSSRSLAASGVSAAARVSIRIRPRTRSGWRRISAQGDVTAHGKPAQHDRPGDLEAIEQLDDLIGHRVHLVDALGRGRLAVARKVGRDHPVPTGQGLELMPPHFLAEREPVEEDDHRPGPRVDVCETHRPPPQ